MAVKKSNTNRGNIQYVKDRKRAERRGPVVARRVAAILVLLVLAVFLCAGIVWSFLWAERALFSENPTFKIRAIEVSISGNKFSESDICEMGKIREGMNLFALNFKDLRKKFIEYPDIVSIEFKRLLPDTLRILVRERVPVARVNSDHPDSKVRCLIDAEGVLLPFEGRRDAWSLGYIIGLSEKLVPGKRLNDEKIKVALGIIKLCNSNPQWDNYIELLNIDVSPYDYVILNLRENNIAKIPLHSLESKLSKLAAAVETAITQGNPPVNMKIDLTPNGDSAFIDRRSE
ncbi:MAG: FtsQ-type POTRA domain-containing protein [Pontiellaceae bacterium]|nr:FtsQ-type POTRA domain-containing protein [Pontiellaceae bacterium]